MESAMKVAALIGEPATGKTTLARRLLSKLSPGVSFKQGLVVGSKHEAEKIIVLGDYETSNIFAGTDRLSMAASPAVEWYIQQLAVSQKGWSVFFEGDRLTNYKFLDAVKKTSDLKIFVLEASEELKKERHSLRGDSQSETFLKSRKTKIERIKKVHPDFVPIDSTGTDPEAGIYSFLIG
jgi:dephospho-CoA kinase